MTYTLFEYCRDNLDTLIPEQSCIKEDEEEEGGGEGQLPGVQVRIWAWLNYINL